MLTFLGPSSTPWALLEITSSEIQIGRCGGWTESRESRVLIPSTALYYPRLFQQFPCQTKSRKAKWITGYLNKEKNWKKENIISLLLSKELAKATKQICSTRRRIGRGGELSANLFFSLIGKSHGLHLSKSKSSFLLSNCNLVNIFFPFPLFVRFGNWQENEKVATSQRSAFAVSLFFDNVHSPLSSA